jgi:hypothetical protein
MIAHVICCNDSVEGVVVEGEDIANLAMEKAKRAYFEKRKWAWPEGYESYERQCYWHIHTVPCLSAEEAG